MLEGSAEKVLISSAVQLTMTLTSVPFTKLNSFVPRSLLLTPVS